MGLLRKRKGIEELRQDRDLEGLTRALNGRNGNAAAAALIELDDLAVVPMLVEGAPTRGDVSSDRFQPRWEIVAHFGERAVAPLTAVLDGDDEIAAMPAAIMLAALDPPLALPPLEAALNQRRAVGAPMGSRARSERVMEAAATGAVICVSRHEYRRPEVLELLLESARELPEKSEYRDHAAKLIEEILIDFDQLRSWLSDDDPAVRAGAAFALSIRGPGPAGSAEADRVDELARALRASAADRDAQVRLNAARALAKWGEDERESLDALAALAADDDVDVAGTATIELASGADPRASRCALALIDRGEEDRVRYGAITLRSLGDASVVPDLRQRLEAASDPALRAELERTIATLEPEGGRPAH